MTTYGTIPTSSPGSANLEYLSRAKERLKSGFDTRRPWKLMFDYRSFTCPSSFGDAIRRIKTNVGYFSVNYAIIVLLILFLSLLWHPISLIVFVAMMAAWLFLYFLRDEPLVVFHRTINDKVILISLSAVTIVLLLLTHVTVNVLTSLAVGAVVVATHASMRKTEDLFMDEEAAGLMTSSSSS